MYLWFLYLQVSKTRKPNFNEQKNHSTKKEEKNNTPMESHHLRTHVDQEETSQITVTTD